MERLPGAQGGALTMTLAYSLITGIKSPPYLSWVRLKDTVDWNVTECSEIF